MKKQKLDIIYEDKSIIVVNKKAGLLTISTDKEKENTLFHQVLEYEKQKSKNNKIFVVHRLDKDTSGLVMFAKSEKIKKTLQANWDSVIRKYKAVVNGIMPKEKGTIESYLAETKTLLVYSTKNPKLGKKAVTSYEVLGSNQKYSLLEIEIKTGRKHQIRVHLNDLGNPLVGDKKYAKKGNNPLGRLGLHAYYLEFMHPVTNKILIVQTSIPSDFLNLTKKVSNK